MIAQRRNVRSIMLKKLFAVAVTAVILCAFLPEPLLEAFAAEISNSQETAVQNDGLEYQTITTQAGENAGDTVTLDGLMPVNAEINVQSSSEYTNDNLFAYDISITDQAGENFQPESNEPITVEITHTAISAACAGAQKPRLWHIDDSGIREEIKNFSIKDDTITFSASGFSVYELDDGTIPLRTYEFRMPSDPEYNADYHEYYFPTSSKNTDGTYKEIWTQTVKGNEKPVFPQLPADYSNHYTFVGWFVGSADGELFDFENVDPVTETETVKLYAVFRSCVYAIFHDQYNGKSDSFPVFATRRGDQVDGAATIPYRDLTVSYDDSADEHDENDPTQMAFKGWTTEPIKDYAAGAIAEVIQDPELTLTETTHFYPVFEPIRWLKFYTAESGKGATYIPPVYFPAEKGFSFSDGNAKEAPTLAGYLFNGWLTEDGQPVTDSDQKIVSGLDTPELYEQGGRLYLKESGADGKKVLQVTLRADWKPTNAKYTIVIWRQKATDAANLSDAQKEYEYAESISVNSVTENVPVILNEATTKGGSGDYYGFHYNADWTAVKNAGKTSVEGDGTTFLDVYYDRNVHTFTFFSNYTEWNKEELHSVSALYGSDITGIWEFDAYDGTHYPLSGQNTSWKPYCQSGHYTARISQMQIMPDEDIDFDLQKTNNTTRYFHYYVEALPEDAENAEAIQFQNENFVPYNSDMKEVTNDFNIVYYNDDFFEIEGFTRYLIAAKNGYVISLGAGKNKSWEGYNGINYSLPESSKNHLYFYYHRNSYKIEYCDSRDGEKFTESELKFQQMIERTAGAVPEPPQAPEGTHFKGWYSDVNCTTRVFFHEPTQAEIDSTKQDENDEPHYQVYTRMPSHPLRIYAGWEEDWCLIEIDPNGGELDSDQSTFFWEKYNGDPIEEYTNATRNYEADVNGEYYYMLHDRAYWGLGTEWSATENSLNRSASYTMDSSKATSATRYKSAPGVYRYLGWYRVDPVTGEETPYNFSTRVTENIKLRLHWKQLGTYNIKYNAGEGTLDDGDQNEATFEFLDANDYSDHADVVVTRVANAPEGYNFVGWKLKNDPSGKVYYPGESFRFSSDYAESVSQINPDTGAIEVKRYLIMNAVYAEIGNASIIYDANGGTVNAETAMRPENAGGAIINQFKLAEGAADDEAHGTVYEATDSQLIVKDLVNNSAVKLSSGDGFTNHGFRFLGWSTEPDGSEHFYNADSIKNLFLVDKEEPLILYAQWEVRVYFDKNNDNADWGGNWTASEDITYIWDSEAEMYYTTINLNAAVDKPDFIPKSQNSDEMFRWWSLEKQTTLGVMKEAFDFSKPVTQDLFPEGTDRLILYGCWSAPIKIPVYIVDTTEETWVRQDDWRINGDETYAVLNDDTPVLFSEKAQADVYAVAAEIEGMDWEMACTQGNGTEDYKKISENTKISQIRYDTDAMKVMVTYTDGTEHEFDPAKEAIYLVYYKSPEFVPINYELMSVEGSLSPVNVKSAAVKTASVVNAPYEMGANDHVSRPRDWAYNGYQYYSFAIGKSGAADVSDLKIITDYSETDNTRPELYVQNTWQGFQYSLDGEHWHNCGYDMELYVIYYEQRPTVVTLTEETIGLPEDMDDEFEYEVVITQTRRQVKKRTYYYYRNGVISGEITDDVKFVPEIEVQQVIETKTVSETNDLTLSDGMEESFVLFYTEPSYSGSENYYYYDRKNYPSVKYRETTGESITQTISIVQKPNSDYITTNDAETGDQIYNSSYTSSADSDPVTITYTNTHKLDLDLHVALKAGSITAHDDLRTDDDTVYRHTFTGAETWEIAAEVSPEAMLADPDSYVFLGIVSGSADGSSVIEPVNSAVTKVSFGAVQDDEYGFYLNGQTAEKLGEDEIWYVYCRKPEIRYLFEKPNGEYEEIAPLTRNEAAFLRNGEPVLSGDILPVTHDSTLLLSQISTPGAPAYLIPGDLDHHVDADTVDQLKLDLNRICVGDASGNPGASDSKAMMLDIRDGDLCYRYDAGDAPQILPENAVVYAVYQVKGYELTLTKTVRGDAGSTSDYQFTVTSDALTYSSYYISTGSSSDEQIEVQDGTLTLTLHDGESVTIYGLLRGDYTITEEAAGSYEMTAQVNGVDAVVSQNQLVASISDDTRVDVVNTYPIPVTGAGEQSAPYSIIVVILSAATLMFICRRKGESADGAFPL